MKENSERDENWVEFCCKRKQKLLGGGNSSLIGTCSLERVGWALKINFTTGALVCGSKRDELRKCLRYVFSSSVCHHGAAWECWLASVLRCFQIPELSVNLLDEHRWADTWRNALTDEHRHNTNPVTSPSSVAHVCDFGRVGRVSGFMLEQHTHVQCVRHRSFDTL